MAVFGVYQDDWHLDPSTSIKISDAVTYIARPVGWGSLPVEASPVVLRTIEDALA